MTSIIRKALFILVVGMMAGGMHLTAVAADPARSYRFDISNQTLGQALRSFGKVSRQEIIFSEDLVKNPKVVSLRGEFTVDDALSRLLEGTGLTAKRASSGVIAIVRADESAGVDAPAGQMRMAVNGDLPGRAGKSESARLEEDRRNQVTVEGQRERPQPFSGRNGDIPRTIDDAQPYYIFDRETIARSGAYNIEDFLKQRLTMNAVAQTNGQTSGANVLGNTSSINLRAVGTDKTLILINGRRVPGIKTVSPTDYQPDLNGIPMSAIDRIEVLPSSASGIYGGSAIGGVVNVILKKDYSGGEVRVAYDNTWDADSSRRTFSGSYGLALEEGKTHLSLSSSWSDAKPLLLQDRVQLFQRNLADIQSHSPNYFYSSTTPWLGALPNIVPTLSTVATLTLKNGGVPLAIGSRNTHVPAGISTTTSAANLAAGLRANAGRWNMEFPLSTQSQTGLLQPFGVTPQSRSVQAGVRRQMLPRLELFVDLSFDENQSESIYNPATTTLTVPINAPNNPFTTAVRVTVPDAGRIPVSTRSQNRSATLGALAQLPGDWAGAVDFTVSENRFEYLDYASDTTARTADLLSGALNPFVDTLLYPLNFQKYLSPSSYQGSSRLYDLALRGSGPLPALPWGRPNLTVGLEHRLARIPERTYEDEYPITVASNVLLRFYERRSTTDSGYLEATLPLIKSEWLPLVHALDLQLSGRSERYQVDTGTSSQATYYNLTPPVIAYTGTTLNNQPYYSEATYMSTNYTVGLKYRPVRELMLRVSRATAFLPPAPDQLIKNPLRSTATSPVNDPVTGQNNVPVYTLSGGNPDLLPQNSRSINAGIVWEPQWQRLAGLRLNAEYYRIEQFDAIGTLTAQQIVSQENAYPGRVVRDSTGRITQVDRSSVNLYHRDTAGWDLSADYSVRTATGIFSLHAMESMILHFKNQYSLTQPESEAVDFPSEGGAVKHRTNATLSWQSGQWAAGWTARYFSSYKQYGAAGGPSSMLNANGGDYLAAGFITAQGSDTIPSQVYHDLFLSYDFGRDAAGLLLRGLTAQFGMRNVFDRVAPLDVYYIGNYFLSPYGDSHLRSYWLNVAKTF